MLVNHHIKYKEIHGEDVVILMEQSEHKKLHQRLRREGGCNIPSNELHKISGNAKDRLKYKDKTVQKIVFGETMCKNIRLIESVRYNHGTGNVIISSYFSINNGVNND